MKRMKKWVVVDLKTLERSTTSVRRKRRKVEMLRAQNTN